MSIGAAARRQRTAVAITDQAVSSLTNVGASVIAARALGVASFGEFAVAMVVVQLCSVIARAAVAEPILIRSSTVSNSALHDATEDAIGPVLGFGAVGGFVCLLASIPGPDSLATVAIVLPGLLCFDVIRHAQFAGGVPGRALAMDTAWLVSAIVALVSLGGGSPATAIGAWAAPATVIAVCVMVIGRIRPSLGGVRRWFDSTGGLAWRLGAEQLLEAVAGQVSLLIVAVVASSEAIGAFQGSRVLYGPLTVAYVGALAVGTTEGARMHALGTEHLRRFAVRLSITLGAGCGVYALALRSLPDEMGAELLGDTWQTAAPLLVPVGILNVGLGISQGYRVGLRVLEAASTTLRIRAAIAPLVVLGAVGGAALAGAPGAAWGMAVPTIVSTFVWRRALLQAAGRTSEPASRTMVGADA